MTTITARQALLARFNITATFDGKDATEDFLRYLVEDNIASGCNDAEKAQIEDDVANKNGLKDFEYYAESFGAEISVSTHWKASEADGSYYRLKDSVLLQAPMLADGDIDHQKGKKQLPLS